MNNLKKLIFLFLICSCFSFSGAHKFYLSVTNAEYVEESSSVQLITRLFVDDFQKLLQTRYDSRVELLRDQDLAENNSYIEKYFRKKLKINIHNQDLQLNFIGKRYEDDLIICYFEIENVRAFSSVKITNLLLTDLFEDQKNLVHFEKDGETESLLLVKDKPTDLIEFD
ncbi:hypothetical protein RBU60_07840 [Mesonia sp. MT50]|uniref:Peptidase E n=1 Tax=Mesonia profundi TaxID=3070998 RepID=A0ABU1A194_9FLAO|nr:DUF6702 family protein [Mesonia profundi]MDQ7917482.1 hypothetical protein [Mesonia profundi]